MWRPWAVQQDPVGFLELDVVWEDISLDLNPGSNLAAGGLPESIGEGQTGGPGGLKVSGTRIQHQPDCCIPVVMLSSMLTLHLEEELPRSPSNINTKHVQFSWCTPPNLLWMCYINLSCGQTWFSKASQIDSLSGSNEGCTIEVLTVAQ